MTRKKLSKKQWMFRGALFGLLMFLFQTIGLPLLADKPLALKGILLHLLVWAVVGYFFGRMGIYLQKKGIQ